MGRLATDEPFPAELAAAFLGAFQRARRTMRRAVRRAAPTRPLPTNQLEVLLAVADAPGIGVSDAANALGLAPNTVSTLVGQLESAGLLRRSRAQSDRRIVQLHLTDAATERMSAWRNRAIDIVAGALEELTEGERQRLEHALPVLERLAEILE